MTCYTQAAVHRGVAQPGRAPRLGRGGRRFKSSLPDLLSAVRRCRSRMPRRPAPPPETLEERWLLEAQTARNLEALAAEHAGELEEAIALYERNVAEGFPGDLPYGRLVAIYERRGDAGRGRAGAAAGDRGVRGERAAHAAGSAGDGARVQEPAEGAGAARPKASRRAGGVATRRPRSRGSACRTGSARAAPMRRDQTLVPSMSAMSRPSRTRP